MSITRLVLTLLVSQAIGPHAHHILVITALDLIHMPPSVNRPPCSRRDGQRCRSSIFRDIGFIVHILAAWCAGLWSSTCSLVVVVVELELEPQWW